MCELTLAFVDGGSVGIRLSWPNEQITRLLPRGPRIRVDGAGHRLRFTHGTALDGHLGAFLDTLRDEPRRSSAGTDVCGSVNLGKDVPRLIVREQEP